MKKIGLLLILGVLLVGDAWGQASVTSQEKKDNRYQLIITDYSHRVNVDDRICSAYSVIYVTGEDGFARNRLQSDMPGGGKDKNHTFSEKKILIDVEPKSIHVYHFAHDARNEGFGSTTCSHGDKRDSNKNLSISCCTLHSFTSDNATGGDINTNRVTFKYRLIPLHTLDAELINGIPNTYLPADDKITLYAKEGFSSHLYHYQYRLAGNSTWENISGSLYSAHQLKVSAKDLFGDNFTQHEGSQIEFRVVSCYSGSDYLSYSEKISLTIVRSAPHIQRTTYKSPICHGEFNGELHIKFDRSLEDNESLYFARKNTITNLYDITHTLAIDTTTLTASIEGLKADFYDFRLYGSCRIGLAVGDTINIYTDAPNHRDSITLLERPKVIYSLTQDSVHCHDGKDGKIKVKANGGTGSYYTELYEIGKRGTVLQTKTFTDSVAYFTDLPTGGYEVYLKDNNGCEYQHPDSVYQKISVLEPAKPLRIFNEDYKEPIGFGYSDGKIWAFIDGGTGAYFVTWKDSIGTVLKTETLTRPSGELSTKSELLNIPRGWYHLEVKDRNWGLANPSVEDNYCGCGATMSIYVNEPPKLLVSIDTLHYVTCNGDNDGELVAHAIGGRPDHTQPMPYKYEWYKITPDSTTVLENYYSVNPLTNDSILKNLYSNYYVVCVTDTNGIQAISKIFDLVQPDPLVVSTNVRQNLLCDGYNIGEMEVIVTGGTPPYEYFWETGEATRTISGLRKGIYSVFVRDARYKDNPNHYCSMEAFGEITSPNGMNITSTIKEPTCNSYADGEITLTITGGVMPYTFLWSDGVTTSNRTNLSDGDYTVTITDANGCSLTDSYSLYAPEPLIVDLGGGFTLCKNRSLTLNGSIGQDLIAYRWTKDGNTVSTDSLYTISTAGIYRLTVTNADGCSAYDEIAVRQSDDELTADFVVATEIPNNKKVYAVNITNTAYDRVEWLMPDDAIIAEQTEHQIYFSIPCNGHYTLGMKGYKGACQDILYKTIEVKDAWDIDDYRDVEPLLKKFIVYPNPNDGNFSAQVELREQMDYTLYLYDGNGNLIETKNIKNTKGAITQFSASGKGAGIYLLRFVSQKMNSTFKVVIK